MTIVMIFYWTGLTLMLLSFTLMVWINRRYGRLLDESLADCREMSEELLRLNIDRLDREDALSARARVEERTDMPLPCFAVYRQGATAKHDVTRLYYNPLDPADRVIMARQAGKIADALNEKS